MYTAFLLSPASCSGTRARRLLSEESDGALWCKLRAPQGGASIGEVFTHVSSLYFRGKLAYAQRFASPPPGDAGVHVITATRGLVSPEADMDVALLREFSSGAIDADEPAYREPLVRTAEGLAERLGGVGRAVLLGSISTDKYLTPLGEVFGDRLWFPGEFVGRGDMSRGGLMLRAADAGTELEYVLAAGAQRRGPRPAKLPPRT